MKRKASFSVLVLVNSLILTLIVSAPFWSRPFRLERLPDKGKNFGCNTCHIENSRARNPFGQDYQKVAMKAGDIYTKELGELDSDKDGFSNDDEFKAGTNPGDPKSRPSQVSTASVAQSELSRAIEMGKRLFSDTKLGKNNMSCNSCHVGGATTGGKAMGIDIPTLRGSAATFPKYKASAKKVITLPQMNNICITMMMKGEPLKLDSDEAVALATYVTSLSNGVQIQVGGTK